MKGKTKGKKDENIDLPVCITATIYTEVTNININYEKESYVDCILVFPSTREDFNLVIPNLRSTMKSPKEAITHLSGAIFLNFFYSLFFMSIFADYKTW